MITLATKVYVSGRAREQALDGLRSLVDNDVGDLDVTATVGVGKRDFATVELEPAAAEPAELDAGESNSGDDADAPVRTEESTDVVAARNALADRWGEIPATLETGERYVGTLEGYDAEALTLDVGREIRIPADELGLGPGDPTQVVERFGLVQHVPLEFVHGDPPRLADATRDRLFDWRRGNGRVNVNSTTRGQARATVNRAGHAADIVTVDRLGLLEQSIVTTPDTDPPGLLSAIGQYLPAECRCVVPQ
jgi:hypothetical protein